MPQADPLPPHLGLSINHRNPVTGSRIVALQFSSSDDTKALMVSNSADFAGAVWKRFSDEVDWKLPSSSSAKPYSATVFAKARDGAGNVSIIDAATIMVDLQGDPDGDGIRNLNDVDDDGDGLRDDDEIHDHHTNPLERDSDGDGLSDRYELKKYRTDPNLGDTDGDGFSDYSEVKAGSDPLDPDSTP